MGAALPFVTVAAVGAQALGSIAGGYAQSASDKANAKIAENNASVATQNATYAGEEGEANAGTQGQKTRQTAGAIKANQGASGVDVNTGSNANVQGSQAMLGQLDMMNIRANAARQAYGYETQATNFENQASIDKAAGKNAVTAGYIKGITGAAAAAASAGQSGAFSGGADAGENLAPTADYANSGASIDNSTLLNGNYNPADASWNQFSGQQGL